MESILFSKINIELRYGIPTDKFWDMWNSEKKDALIRARMIPKPIGFELGEETKWVVKFENDYVSRMPEG